METNKTGLRSLPVNVWIVTATSFLTDISSEMVVYLSRSSSPMYSKPGQRSSV